MPAADGDNPAQLHPLQDRARLAGVRLMEAARQTGGAAVAAAGRHRRARATPPSSSHHALSLPVAGLDTRRGSDVVFALRVEGASPHAEGASPHADAAGAWLDAYVLTQWAFQRALRDLGAAQAALAFWEGAARRGGSHAWRLLTRSGPGPAWDALRRAGDALAHGRDPVAAAGHEDGSGGGPGAVEGRVFALRRLVGARAAAVAAVARAGAALAAGNAEAGVRSAVAALVGAVEAARVAGGDADGAPPLAAAAARARVAARAGLLGALCPPHPAFWSLPHTSTAPPAARRATWTAPAGTSPARPPRPGSGTASCPSRRACLSE